jgi:hypothetical protein
MNKSLGYTGNWIVDSCHVSKSNIQVIRHVYSKMSKATYWNHPKDERKQFLQAIIDRHEKNIKLYISVMTGRF